MYKSIWLFCSCCLLFIAIGCKNNASQSKYEDFAKEIESHIQKGDPSFFNDHFEFDAIIDDIVASVGTPEDHEKSFRNNIKQELNVGATFMSMMGKDGLGSIKFLRLRNFPDKPTALFRFASSEGLNYMEAYLKNTRDGIKISDFYVYQGGLSFAPTLRRLYYTPLVDSIQLLDLSKTPAADKAYIGNFATIDSITAMAQAQQFEEALALYKKMPNVLQEDKMLQVMKINLAAASKDESAYQQAVDGYQKIYPDDPALVYMQMQHALAKRDTNAIFPAIEKMDKTLGGDNYLKVILSDVYYEFKQPEKAATLLREVIKQEPNLQDAYLRISGLLIDMGKYDEAVDYFAPIKEKFGYNPANFLPTNEYQEFWASEAYKKWEQENPLDTTYSNMPLDTEAEGLYDPHNEEQKHDH